MLWRSANCNGLRWCRLWKISLSFYFSSMINQRWLRKILSKNLNKIANRRRHNKLCLESYFSYLKRLPSKKKSSFSFSSSYPPHMGWLSGDQVVARAEHCHHHSPGLAPLLALWQLQLGSWSSSSFSQNSAKNDLSYNWQPVTYFVSANICFL